MKIILLLLFIHLALSDVFVKLANTRYHEMFKTCTQDNETQLAECGAI